jgi:hypothetical protein
MRLLAFLCCALGLAACASVAQPPPGAVVAEDRLRQMAAPGASTRATILAQLGPTTSLRFDSGYEVWRYLTPAGPGAYGEYVIVFDPRGVVAKARFAPQVYQWARQ